MIWLLLLFACSSEPPPTPPAPPAPVAAPEPVPQAEDTAPPVAPNSRPRIMRFDILPTSPKTNNDLRVELATEDVDGDLLHIDRTWYQNGEKAFGIPGRYFPSSRTKKGDRILMEVVVEDRREKVVARSPEVTVLNSPPEISNRTKDLSRIDGFQVKATDLDGDTLTYKLSGAPPALTIDSKKGILHYQGSSTDPAGQYQVKITVDDGDGGWAEWTFGMTVSAGSNAPKEEDPAQKSRKR